MPVLVQIIAEFQTLYPDVLFDVLYVPRDDLLARYQVEAGRGGGPTILLAPGEWGPALYDSGLVVDLNNLSSSNGVQGALNRPAVRAAHYSGALVGLPYTIRGVVLYRNRDIVRTKEISFDGFVAASQASTAGERIGAYLERSFFFSGGHLEGIGGQLMDEDGLPAFNDQKGLEWLALLSSITPMRFASRPIAAMVIINGVLMAGGSRNRW